MKIKDIWNYKIVKIVTCIISGILLLYNLVFVINILITDKEYIDLFGISISIANDDTMKGSISKNSLVICSKYDLAKIKVDDRIAIQANDNLKFRRVTKIIENEPIQVVVKGDNNYFNDTQYVSKDTLYGKVVITIPLIGILFRLFQSKIITLIVLFLTIYVIYNVRQIKKRRQKTRKIRKEIKKNQQDS